MAPLHLLTQPAAQIWTPQLPEQYPFSLKDEEGNDYK